MTNLYQIRNKILHNKKSSKFFIWGLLVLLIIISALWLINKDRQSLPPIPSLTASKTAAKYDEEQRSISYYITTSQEFLNKARHLSNSPNDGEQTPEKKQEIISLINQALDLANQAIAFYANDDRSFSQRAYLYEALVPFLPESVNFAIQDLKETTKLNRQNPQYHSRLAELYLKAGNFENAALSFYNSHLLSPTDIQTIYNLANALEKSGQLQKANYFFEKLISLLPPEDKNLETIKSRQEQLKAVLAQSNLQFLTQPGADLAPLAGSEEKIIGTQELPLEQAAIAGRVIIANPEEKAGLVEQTSSLTINAKSGISIIPGGKTEVTVNSNQVANNRQIILTPIGETENKILFLKAKKAYDSDSNTGWFKVGIDKAISRDLEFKWWIID